MRRLKRIGKEIMYLSIDEIDNSQILVLFLLDEYDHLVTIQNKGKSFTYNVTYDSIKECGAKLNYEQT